MVDGGWWVVELEESIILLGVDGGWWVVGGRVRRKHHFTKMMDGRFRRKYLLLRADGGWWVVDLEESVSLLEVDGG